MEEQNKEPKSEQQQIKDAGNKLSNAGKGTSNAGKKVVDLGQKAVKVLMKMAPILFNPWFWIITIGLLIVLVIFSYVANLIGDVKVDEVWTEMFPGSAYGSNQNSGKTGEVSSIVEAAKTVHAIIEQQKYTYGSNGAATVEESEASGGTTVDCSTYVDWVLAKVGLKLPSRLCTQPLKDALDAADWCENIGTNPTDAKAGDLVLFVGHIQIYAGADNAAEESWYNARKYNSNSSTSSSW